MWTGEKPLLKVELPLSDGMIRRENYQTRQSGSLVSFYMQNESVRTDDSWLERVIVQRFRLKLELGPSQNRLKNRRRLDGLMILWALVVSMIILVI